MIATDLLTSLRMMVFVVLGIMISVQPGSAQRKKNRKTEPPPEFHGIVLADKALSTYHIVIPASPTTNEQKAATVLQEYLIRISDAVLPIVSSGKTRSPYEIVLGQNGRLDELGISVNFNELGRDGFIIRTDSLRLLITGGNGKGTLYGVYTFLEKYLSCRMYSPQKKVIPKKDKIILGTIDDKQIPVIRFRDTHY